MSIESYPNPNGVLTSLIWRKTAVGGETSLSGYDNASQALSYTPGQEQVYLNGILLVRGSDYTATNGTSITGLTALTADDFVQVNCYNNFSVASVPAASITGTVTNAQLANSAITINGTSTSLGGTYTNASASTSTAGIVQLTDSTSSTSTSTAATPNSVKSAYDLANGAIPKTLTTTTGDIIYASGANTPARLGIGSTGNVLTVSGGVPSWSAPVSGAYTLLSTTTLSGTSTTVSSISSAYKHLRVVILGMSHNGGGSPTEVYPRMRFNSDTGNNYSDVRYSANEDNNIQPQTIGAIDYLRLYGTALNNTQTTSQMVVDIFNYTDTTVHKQTDTKSYMRTMGGGWNAASLHGVWLSTSAISSITFLLSTASFDNGTVYLYGVN